MTDYPDVFDFEKTLNRWAQLKAEYGADGLTEKVAEIKQLLHIKLNELLTLPEDAVLARAEPDDLAAIRALRPAGHRRLWLSFPGPVYQERLAGALLGRFAGCTLGSPVEAWSIEKMRDWAAYVGDPFPPQDYWSQVERPTEVKYQVCRREQFARKKIEGVPDDDDIIYTLLGLMILEAYGPDFTVEDVGQAWLRHLPLAATAEAAALNNLRAGIPARDAGRRNNPWAQWIGAGIRADPWGYAAPGWPARAAAMAYHDACISHRRNGVFAAMYFAAVISAAFAVDDPVEALHIGLEEIPPDCRLARVVGWALREAPGIHTYADAHAAVAARFPGMSPVHAVNNACLVVWGLTLGGQDFTGVIGQTVAMGFDNDCNAATAGSIAGAILGRSAIPAHWYRCFNNTVHSYLNGYPSFALDDLVARFTAQAKRVFAASKEVVSD